MNVLMQVAVALAPVFAGWAVAAAVAAIHTSRADLATSARRGLMAATACAVIATVGLVAALNTGDLTVRFVAQTWSVLVPARYLPAALLSAPGGSLLALSGLTGIVALIVARTSTPVARTWAVGLVGGAMLVPLLIVAVYTAPFGARPASADGAGLSPDLQRDAAALHGVALLFATAFATCACAETLAALAAQAVDGGWSRRVRRWNALAWTSLFVAVVAGAQWYAFNPNRGPWLEAPSTVLWLLPCVAGAWLTHLDTGAQDGARVVTRILLSVGVFVAMIIALAFSNGAFVNGVTAADDGRAGALVGILAALSVALLISRLRRAAGVLRSTKGLPALVPSAAGAWIAHAGLVLVLSAAAGSRFSRDHTVTLGDAEIFRAKDPFGHQWQFSSQGVSTLQRENYASSTLSLLPQRDDQRLGMLSAETRWYGLADGADSGQPAFITGKLSGAFMDTRLTIIAAEGKRPTVRVAFVPLAPWLIVGAWLVAIGSLLAVAAHRHEVANDLPR